MTILEFLDALAAKTPTPGGGSASALCGSIGISLGIMVSRFSNNPVEGPLVELKAKLYPIIEEDAAAYDMVKNAMKLPKGEERTKQLQEALVGASKVPFRGMETATEALGHVRTLADSFNQNLVTDLMAACDLLFTAINGFSYNVLINVKMIKNQEFRRKMSDDVNSVLSKAEEYAKSTREKLLGIFNK